MKSILVIGTGRFGYHLIRKIADMGDEILAVDRSEENLKPVLEYVTSSLIGDATDPEFINTIGVSNFDV